MQKPDSYRTDALGHGGLAATQSGAPETVPEKLFADSYPPSSFAAPSKKDEDISFAQRMREICRHSKVMVMSQISCI